MQCVSPIKLHVFDIEVPCRKCIACRIAISREWQIRLAHERSCHDTSSFLTLSYDNEHIPADGSVSKRELQLFMKRLRENWESPIRYFAVGEYGGLFGRPHYHAIMFGLGIEHHQMDPRARGHVLGGAVLEAWGKGFCYLGTVTPQSIRYVTDYVFKQLGPEGPAELGGKAPPVKIHSMGLGREWVKTHQDYLMSKLCVTVKGQPIALPRYYISKLVGDKEDISAARAVLRQLAQERKHKRLEEQGINSPAKLAEYLDSVRLQRRRDLEARLGRIQKPSNVVRWPGG